MRGFKFCLHKAYFDKGFTLLNYLKYIFALIGIGAVMAKVSVLLILAVAFAYAALCYFLGWWWLNRGFLDAENEVQNRFNPFCKDMRNSLYRKT